MVSRSFLIKGIHTLMDDRDFRDALPSFLAGDSANQARLPLLRKKLESIARLCDESAF
jgi:hypothetical protein